MNQNQVLVTKVTLNVQQIKALLNLSKQAGTVEAWADVAVEWMESADNEINRLNQIIVDLKNGDAG